MKINIKFIKIYFYILILISVSITFLTNRNINSYCLILFIVTTFPVFAILTKISFNQFSDILELKHPNLFTKYKMTFGVTRRLNMFEIFNNSDFEKLNDIELIESLKRTKTMFKLTITSFVVFIVLGIGSSFI